MICSASILFEQEDRFEEDPSFHVFDVRDFVDPEGRGVGVNGKDTAVQSFVFEQDGAQGVLDVAQTSYDRGLNICFVCFGGKNRSVAFAEELARRNDQEASHYGLMMWAVIEAEGEGKDAGV